jgi:hypothetical protein
MLAGNAESRAQMAGPDITVRLPPQTLAAFDVRPAR